MSQLGNTGSHPPRIYFINAPELDLMKIGWSTNIADRLRAIRSSELGGELRDTELVLVGSIPGDCFGEHVLHRHFACARVQGEWFQSDAIRHFVDDIVTMTDEQVAAWFDWHRRKHNGSDKPSAKQLRHWEEVESRRARRRRSA